MKNNKLIYIGIGIVIVIGLVGYSFGQSNSKKQNEPTALSVTPTVVTAQQEIATDTSSWTEHTNKTYHFSIKFPKTYEVQPGSEEQNTCIRLNVDSPCEVLINVYPNNDNLSLEDYLSKKSIAFSIDGPLVPYNFNGYDTIFNRNQPGTNLFIKRGLTVFRFVASKASSDKEIGDIVATFKFTQ